MAATKSRTILDPGDDSGRDVAAMVMGIDLGTSRSSIASMNGVRKTVDSYVGFARIPFRVSTLGAGHPLRA